MRLALFRPINGWRAFWSEITIVVLGVLIALGAQQFVEEWNWRKDASSTTAALRAEIGRSIGYAVERKMIDRCLRERLLVLIAAARQPEPDWKASRMPLNFQTYQDAYREYPVVYRSPWREFSDNGWQAAKASGVFAHFDHDEATKLSRLYDKITEMKAYQSREANLFPLLLPLGYDQQLDTAARQEIISRLGALYWLNQAMVESADDLIGMAKEGGPWQREQIAAQIADLEKSQRRFRGACVEHEDMPL